MNILAIDPGHTQSAFVLYDLDAGRPILFDILPNDTLLHDIRTCLLSYERVVIEMVASYGMAVGREVFETVYWIGRYAEAAEITGAGVERLFRADVKLHLCNARNAKDSNIRQALLDRFGPGKELAVGKKKMPGPLYGMAKDEWAALAVAVTYADKCAVTAVGTGPR